MVNQAARNKKKKAKKQAAARQDTGSATEAEQDAYLAAAHAQAQLERERLALEHQRRAALVEAAAAAEFQGRQLQHGSYHVAPDGTVYDEHGELMEDEDDEEEDDEEDEDDLDDEDLEDEEDDDEDEDDDDDDLLDEDEELRIEVDHQVLQEHQRYIRQQQQASQSQQHQQSRSRQPSSTTAAAATHEALLGTANDLYKQIENAAAAALSGAHAGQQRGGGAGVNAASFSTSLFPAATGGEEDDAYWLSLPSHLRSFIRSALPLAAGLSTSPQSQQQQQQGGNNGLPTAQQINLTPDQMAAAAAQLAQVVQNGWASTLAKEPLDSPLRSALLNAQQQQANAQSGQRGSGNSTTTTIPLGAFALPLHPHPDSPEAAAAFQAAAQAAAQAAVGGGNNNGSSNNGGNQSSTLPFPSLANLQASLLQLAKMPPGDLASHPGFPGNPFTTPASNNNEGVPTSPPSHMPQQAPGESKSSKKKKKKQASQAAAAAAAVGMPTPQQPPMSAQPMQPIPERQYAPLRTSKISPVNTKASSPVNPKATSPVNAKAPPPPARVATPNNGKQPAQQPPPSNGKSVANGKQPAVASAPVRSDSGKGRQIPIQNTAPSSTSPVNTTSAQQQQYQQQPQTGIRPTPSAVANGKRPLVATRSAVPVVPSAPAKSVTGNTINNPPAPPPVAQQPHDRDTGKKRATRESAPTPTTANTAYGGGPTASSSTSSGERAKIRDFWLGLSERDRRDLVKVEKDAVLKKMKEQQRHGCTCAVCVRKRQAIEVELEVLYDAYYDELESYAHHQKAYEKSKGMDPKIPPPLGPGPFPGSVDVEKMVTSPMTSSNNQQQQQAQPPPSTKSASNNNAYTAPKKNSNPTTGNNSPVKGKIQPPPPPATANAAAAKTTANTQSKDKHSHSPSCPHYPHTHDHKHHHHHAPSSKDRGKATQNAPPVAASRKHHHHHHHHRDDEEDYISDEDEYDDEDDDGEYDDEDDYDGEDDIPETDEEDMPPLEGMDSADEAPPQPPVANPPGGRRGTHPPVAQPRRNTAPPPKAAQQQPAQVAKRDVGAPNSGGDFFGFGSSLTVKGILTVAEDLLKNDGQKFLEMMESLADKRIQRERAAVDGFSESEYEDDEEEEEYDEEEEEEEEDEDELDEEDGEGVEEPLTEEQKMEEGRRMFQVFAARMFEQRVLTAYREKIAQERQMQLLRELEEEDRQAAEREAKKAKDAQKKKDKKKLAKQQKDQERLQAETDRLAAEAAAKAEAEAKAEEERRRADESRAKREAEKKAKEAELLRRNEHKKNLLAEEARKRKEEKDRAREAKIQREKEEQERRAQKEKDEAERRAKREEQERKERAAREAKEKEAAAKKAQLEAEKAAKEKAEREKQEKEAAAKAAARASPLTVRQVPGQTARSVSSKVVPGLPKPPAPPTPSPALNNAVNATQGAPGPGMNGAQHGASMLQTPQQRPGQTPQHMPFSSNSFVSGLSATSPMSAGRPSFGNPTFGQQAPIGFSSASQHAYPQTSFGTFDAISPNQSQRSAPGPPGIGGSGRIVSPSHQQQHQGFNGPPGMQIPGSVSPMASQRSPFTSFGVAGSQPGMHPGATSPFSSARPHVNGMGSTLSPGPNTAPLAAGQGVTQPMPIGRGHASASRASPGSGQPGSASLNSSSFQHSASGLAALNMDSQVVQRSGFAPSSQQNQSSMPPGAPHSAAPGHARKASQSSVHPIGRPASRFGSEAGSFGAMGMSDFLSSTDEDPAGTSASSLRSISPPPAVLGSGALLDDMMEEEGLDLAPDMASPSLGARPGVSQSSSAAFFGNSVFGPPMLGGPPSKAADDVWASTPASSSHDNPSKGAGWNSGPQPPMMAQQPYGSNPFQAPAPQVVPDRGSVIRDRAKIAFTQLDTAYSTQSAGRSSNYPIGDVYRVFLALYPDSASVDVREFLESCLVPGTIINGNGTFSFQQQGQVLLMNYEANKTDGEYLPFGSGQSAEPIGAR